MNLRKFNAIRIIITTLALANGTFLLAQDREVKIAIVQIFCLDGDRSGNFVRIENAIDEASKKGADIVILNLFQNLNLLLIRIMRS